MLIVLFQLNVVEDNYDLKRTYYYCLKNNQLFLSVDIDLAQIYRCSCLNNIDIVEGGIVYGTYTSGT